MTAKELIVALKKFPVESVVVVGDSEYGECDVIGVTFEMRESHSDEKKHPIITIDSD